MKKDILELVNILTFQKSTKKNKFNIKIDQELTFEINGVWGYVFYLDLNEKKLYLKVDPDHKNPNQQETFETMKKVVSEIKDWEIKILLT